MFRLPLRHHLLVLVLVALVPVVAFMVSVVVDLGREQREVVQRGLEKSAQALAIAVEHHIAASVRALEAMAASEVLFRDDLRAFRGEIERALETQGEWSIVVLTDPRGQILASTATAHGARVPDVGDRPYFQELVATRRPVVSDLIVGRVTGERNVTVAVPVLRDGALRYALLAAINVSALSRMLADEPTPTDSISGLADRSLVLIASTRDHERFVGRELIAPMKAAALATPHGSGRFSMRNSPDVYAAWQRLPSLGWTVTFGASAASVDAPRSRALREVVLVGLAVTLASVVVAVVWGRAISGAVASLVPAAGALARGAMPVRGRSAITEIDAVAQAMRTAGLTIAERTAQVAAGQARIRRLVDSSLIGIIVGEREAITDANDAFLRMIGYSRAELLDGKLRWSALTVPEGKAQNESAHAALAAAGERPREMEVIRKDGTRVPLLIGTALLDATGTEWVAFTLDLTDRRRAEAEQALRSEAEIANRAKDEFLAMVSHELRTPLGAMLASIHTLHRSLGGDPRVADTLARLERSTRLQARLISDLLDVSRIVAGKLTLEFRSVSITRVVEDAVAALRLIDDKGVKVETVVGTDSCEVLGDGERLQQTILNLVGNAIKFTPAGGRVEVRVHRRGPRVVVAVHDTGCGIEPELLPHVFERFRQAPSAPGAASSGLGLGLAIVRYLVEAHGGSVRAESAGPGTGSVFTVDLPATATMSSAL